MALFRLMAWLSPAFPVGAFAYSHALEWAVEAGEVTSEATLHAWLTLTLTEGGPAADATLFAHAHRAAAAQDGPALAALAALAAAFAAGAERRLETRAQGDAFIAAAAAAWPTPALAMLKAHHNGPVAYPVAVAVTAAGHGVPLAMALRAFLHAVAANLISAGVRLIPLGQTAGARLLAAMEPVVEAVARTAPAVAPDDLGSAVLRADLASFRHETQYTRLFRT